MDAEPPALPALRSANAASPLPRDSRMTTKDTRPVEIDLPTVDVSWSEDGCLLELTGHVNQQLLDHARDVVYAQTKPNTTLVVRLRRAIVTHELLAMLDTARRLLAGQGSSLEVDDARGPAEAGTHQP